MSQALGKKSAPNDHPVPSIGFGKRSFSMRLSDRTLTPELLDSEARFVEDEFHIRVDYDTGETKFWSFNDLKWWAHEHHYPDLYEKVLNRAISLDELLWRVI